MKMLKTALAVLTVSFGSAFASSVCIVHVSPGYGNHVSCDGVAVESEDLKPAGTIGASEILKKLTDKGYCIISVNASSPTTPGGSQAELFYTLMHGCK